MVILRKHLTFCDITNGKWHLKNDHRNHLLMTHQ